MVFLDTIRAREIMKSKDSIEVLYQDSPVWLESVKENNVAVVIRSANQERIEVPVYMLVENRPAAR